MCYAASDSLRQLPALLATRPIAKTVRLGSAIAHHPRTGWSLLFPVLLPGPSGFCGGKAVQTAGRPRRSALERALWLQAMLDSGGAEGRAALARHLGITRAAVTQGLRPPASRTGTASRRRTTTTRRTSSPTRRQTASAPASRPTCRGATNRLSSGGAKQRPKRLQAPGRPARLAHLEEHRRMCELTRPPCPQE